MVINMYNAETDKKILEKISQVYVYTGDKDGEVVKSEGTELKYGSDVQYCLVNDIQMSSKQIWTVPDSFTGTIIGTEIEENEIPTLYDKNTDTIYIYNPYQLMVLVQEESETEPVMSLDYDAPQFGMGQMIYPDGYYEIISGHRRKHAAEKLGYRKVPVIIRVLSEDDSILSMVDSNLHRERISYSEKAFAYKLKNDVLKRKSGRNKWPVWGAGGKDGSVNYFQFIDADGTISEPMGIAARRVMNTNDVVRMVTATGGGYGDPFKRPADKVAMDVKNEYITVDQAKEDYGVLVDPETFKVLGLTEERQKAEK